MIPKIIHYCWFGFNEPPAIIKKCIDSWKKMMPDYEIRRWDESNFDVNASPFMKEAYISKKYAYVSDYARYMILCKEGGIFLDADVELLKPIDVLLEKPFSLGINKHIKKNIVFVNPGLFIASEPDFHLLHEILDFYNSIHFLKDDNTPNYTYSSPRVLTSLLKTKYNFKIKDETQMLNDEIKIFSSIYFDPINPRKLFGNKMEITSKTYAIHYGTGTWIPLNQKIKRVLSIICRNIVGDGLIDNLRGKEKISYE